MRTGWVWRWPANSADATTADAIPREDVLSGFTGLDEFDPRGRENVGWRWLIRQTLNGCRVGWHCQRRSTHYVMSWRGRCGTVALYFDEDGSEYLLQFKPSEIEVTLNIDFSVTGEAEAGIKWWLVNASAKGVGYEFGHADDQAVTEPTPPWSMSTPGPVRATEILIDGPVTDDDATEYH